MSVLACQKVPTVQDTREELKLGLDKVFALIDLASAARLPEISEKTLFNYFHIISEALQQVKLKIDLL